MHYALQLVASLSKTHNTIFVRSHAHARIDTHSSQNSACSRTWKFLCYFCILQSASSANNMEIFQLCMHNSSHVSLLYWWVRLIDWLIDWLSTEEEWINECLTNSDLVHDKRLKMLPAQVIFPDVVNAQCVCEWTNTVHNMGSYNDCNGTNLETEHSSPLHLRHILANPRMEYN